MNQPIISPLNQKIFEAIYNLLNNTVSNNGKPIWVIEKNIFMLGLHNNITLPKDGLYILIIREKIKSLIHQQAPIKNYSNKTLSRVYQEMCSIKILSSCPSTYPIGYALEEAWMETFYQNNILEWIKPFSLMNIDQRLESNSDVKQIDNGLFMIRHTFRFNLTYSKKNVTNFQTYDRIDQDINQLNIG